MPYPAFPWRPLTFDASGPTLGPVRLLETTRSGFKPKPKGRLGQELVEAFGMPIPVDRLVQGLASVCRAMNERDLAPKTALHHFPPKRRPKNVAS